MQDNLMESIEQSKTSELKNNVKDSVKVTWLLFTIQNKSYAIASSSAEEILRNLDLYKLPFVPEYISGVVNRHGDPYAVVDLSILFGEQPQETSLFIVLNLSEEQFCLRITDILDFHTVGNEELLPFSKEADIPFFNGTINYKNEQIPVLNLSAIYDKIRSDLGRK